MSAALLETPLKIDQGATFVQSFILTDPNNSNAPINLTGYTATAQVRKTYASEILRSFVCTIPAPLTGEVVIQMDEADTLLTSEESAPPTGRCDTPVKTVWDLFIDDGAGVVTRLVYGEAWFYPRVSEA